MPFLKRKKLIIFVFLFLFVFLPILTPANAETADFVPITEDDAGEVWDEVGEDGSFSDMVNKIYKYTIVISAMLAVVVITIGGFQYMGEASYSSKKQGKERITNAIIGILIIVGAVLILNIINPNIAKLELFGDVGTVESNNPEEDGNDEDKCSENICQKGDCPNIDPGATEICGNECLFGDQFGPCKELGSGWSWNQNNCHCIKK